MKNVVELIWTIILALACVALLLNNVFIQSRALAGGVLMILVAFYVYTIIYSKKSKNERKEES